MSSNGNGILIKVFWRFLAYSLVIFAIALSLPMIVEYGDFTMFTEGGPIEWLQFVILIIAPASLLFFACFKRCDYRHLFVVLALLQVCASIRELDMMLDRLIPLFGWKLPFGGCVSVGIVWLSIKKEGIVSQAKVFVRTRAFSLLWCGFIVTVPFAQLVGHGKFLSLLMGDDYTRDYKRVIEELCELLGYMLLLAGSIEAILQEKEENGAGGS